MSEEQKDQITKDLAIQLSHIWADSHTGVCLSCGRAGTEVWQVDRKLALDVCSGSNCAVGEVLRTYARSLGSRCIWRDGEDLDPPEL
jgi:hypothetical protein